MLTAANRAILNSSQKYGGSDLLTVMDIDLNYEFTSALGTVKCMSLLSVKLFYFRYSQI